MLHPHDIPNLGAVRQQHQQIKASAQTALRGPAIAMIVVAGVGAASQILAWGFDILLLSTGAIERFDNPDVKKMQIFVRMFLGVIVLANCAFSIWAGMHLQRLQQHQLCWLAAVLLCIPALGPCVCLGIPIGIWAITVLSRSEVAEAFD